MAPVTANSRSWACKTPLFSQPCKIHLRPPLNRKFCLPEVNRACSPLMSCISTRKTGRKKAVLRPRRTMARSNQRTLHNEEIWSTLIQSHSNYRRLSGLVKTLPVRTVPLLASYWRVGKSSLAMLPPCSLISDAQELEIRSPGLLAETGLQLDVDQHLAGMTERPGHRDRLGLIGIVQPTVRGGRQHREVVDP